MEGPSITGSVDLSSEIRTRVIPGPAITAQNTTRTRRVRARKCQPPRRQVEPEHDWPPRPAAPRGQKSAGEVPKSEPPATPRLGNSRSVRDPGWRVQPGPCAKHRPSWATRSTQLRQDGGGIPVASPAPALGGP